MPEEIETAEVQDEQESPVGEGGPPIKLSDDEIASINTIVNQKVTLTSQLGSLYLQKLEAEATLASLLTAETQLVEGIRATEIVEQELVANFTAKYGEGRLDPVSGVFVPADTQ